MQILFFWSVSRGTRGDTPGLLAVRQRRRHVALHHRIISETLAASVNDPHETAVRQQVFSRIEGHHSASVSAVAQIRSLSTGFPQSAVAFGPIMSTRYQLPLADSPMRANVPHWPAQSRSTSVNQRENDHRGRLPPPDRSR